MEELNNLPKSPFLAGLGEYKLMFKCAIVVIAFLLHGLALAVIFY